MTQPNDQLQFSVEVYKSLLEMLQKLRNLPDLKGDGNLTRERAIEVLDILLEPLSETLQVNVGGCFGRRHPIPALLADRSGPW